MAEAAGGDLPPTITGLRLIAPRFDGYILDVWGVLHDGFKPYPGVVDCLERLRAAEKRIVVLSNAPRRAIGVVERLTELGIPETLYDGALSSGEEVWQHLATRPDAFYAGLGRHCLFIGPPRDESMMEALGLHRVEAVAEADFILSTGPWGWEANAARYEALLQEGARRRLPMICANPDLVVRLGDRLAICAGTLAQRYEALGGPVRWHGKPYRSVYETCLARLGTADRSRILAVGDSLRTDIAGAAGAAIASLFITGGIHAEDFAGAEGGLDSARLAGALRDHGCRPDFVMPQLAW